MARVLIVGCGCRGLLLARALRARGHAVRGTTRDPGRAAAIEAAGAQPYIGDPDRVGSLTPALDGVAVVCLLLGSAYGRAEDLAALHGSRLEMLLTRLVDTTVRGVLYEVRGSVAPPLLRQGASSVSSACLRSRIPHGFLGAEPSEHELWTAAAVGCVERLLAGGGEAFPAALAASDEPPPAAVDSPTNTK